MKFLVFFLLAALPSLAFACVDDVCKELERAVAHDVSHVSSKKSGRIVVGQGRLQFYSAPSESCEVKGVFVVPGDELDVSVEYGEFAAVLYFTKKGEIVDGWVRKDRLSETGRGIGPTEE